MRVDYLKSYLTFKTHLFNTNTHFTVFPLNHCLLINIYIYIYIPFNIDPHFEYTR